MTALGLEEHSHQRPTRDARGGATAAVRKQRLITDTDAVALWHG